MKKTIIFFLIYLTHQTLFSQDLYQYFMLSGGLNTQRIYSKSYNKFENNYMNYHSNKIDKSKNIFGSGFYIQANFSPFPLANLEYSNHNSSKEIVFKNGDKMKFKFSQNLFRINMGINLGDFEDVGFIIKPEFSLGFGTSKLKVEADLTDKNDKDNTLAKKYKEGSMVMTLGINFIYKREDSPLGFKAYIRQNWTPITGNMMADGYNGELLVDYAYWRNTNSSDIWRYGGDYVKDDFRFLEIGLGICLIVSDLDVL